MGLFDDFSQFLENRLEEFLQNNPHLELQALEEQLHQQEEDTLRLIIQLQRQEKKLEQLKKGLMQVLLTGKVRVKCTAN